MFQPAEETMDGAKMMVENGILKDPDVNAALGIHVFTNLPLPAGTVIMTGADSKMAAVDWFTIKITGKGCHGAQPNNGVCLLYTSTLTPTWPCRRPPGGPGR